MRLQSIHLKNFGSFKDVTVNLSAISACVITGQNGTGKSTLFIDSVLWALFGSCRVSTDEMMRIGTGEMAATVEFTLTGQRYRVIRQRSLATKAGKSELSLQVWGGSEWQGLSGARLAETQEKIGQLLNLDYELLTATGFLVQGKADRFTAATPGERKTILSQILRLDRYPRLKSAASSKTTALAVRVDGLRDQVTTEMARAGTLEGLLAERVLVKKKTEEVQSKRELQVVVAQDLRRQLGELQALVDGLAGLEEKIAAGQKKVKELKEKQRALLDRQVRAQKILANKATIEAKVLEEAELKRQLAALDGERAQMDEQVARAIDELAQIRCRLAEGVSLQQRATQAQHRLEQALAAYGRETARMVSEIERDERDCVTLGQVPCGAELQGRCQFTIQTVQVQAALPAKRAAVAARFSDGQSERIAPDEWQARVVADALVGCWQAKACDEEELRVVEALRRMAEQQREVEGRRKAIGESLTKIDEFTGLVQELAGAQREVQQASADLAGVLFDSEVIEGEAVGLVAQLTAAKGAAEKRAALNAQLFEADSLAATHQRTLDGLAVQQGQIDERVKHAEVSRDLVGELSASVEVALAEMRQFSQLMEAYQQIPVLILESAMPLLEQETNRILGRVSRAGMSVRYDTQKTLKSRDGLAETLDVWIRDVHGERRYEAFSGGEKFRLDLAIRIGLSKLLSHRAGATLDTLVIDEGLGSLDPDALAQVRECLSALQDEFPLLLVVTHVDAMKETFPSQILVTEGVDGSEIEVLA